MMGKYSVKDSENEIKHETFVDRQKTGKNDLSLTVQQ